MEFGNYNGKIILIDEVLTLILQDSGSKNYMNQANHKKVWTNNF
jgi:hypothetical protein